jgi:hypothetical protein
MDQHPLKALRSHVAEVISRRRKLGGYSAEANTILGLWETNLAILDHLIPSSQPPKIKSPKVAKKKK